MTRDPKSTAKFTAKQTFKAIAKSADVQYIIDAKANKVLISIYMDELDQTSVKLPGLGKSIGMICSGTDHGQMTVQRTGFTGAAGGASVGKFFSTTPPASKR